MKIPDAIDLHRFFAPECDLSLGNCATADVEKRRAVPKTRVASENMVPNRELGGGTRPLARKDKGKRKNKREAEVEGHSPCHSGASRDANYDGRFYD